MSADSQVKPYARFMLCYLFIHHSFQALLIGFLSFCNAAKTRLCGMPLGGICSYGCRMMRGSAASLRCRFRRSSSSKCDIAVLTCVTGLEAGGSSLPNAESGEKHLCDRWNCTWRGFTLGANKPLMLRLERIAAAIVRAMNWSVATERKRF